MPTRLSASVGLPAARAGSRNDCANLLCARREMTRREQEKRDFERGLALLNRLRDDQVEYVRHLLRSWCGTTPSGASLSEANVHMPVCRRAIKRALRDRP